MTESVEGWLVSVEHCRKVVRLEEHNPVDRLEVGSQDYFEEDSLLVRLAEDNRPMVTKC
jgi:hypothetical protein